MIRYKVLNEAAQELEEALAYLSVRSSEAALGLLSDYEKAVNLVRAYPRGFAADRRGIRKHALSRYSYSVVYKVSAKLLTVVAFVHQKRRPRYWVKRVKN